MPIRNNVVGLAVVPALARFPAMLTRNGVTVGGHCCTDMCNRGMNFILDRRETANLMHNRIVPVPRI
jgi:hypothetical protein